jgi:transcriptional regulator with XRE-family HTH domain
MERPKRSNRQTREASTQYLHSPELRALIARLKSDRMRRGLSTRDVARVTNQARSALSRLENGHYPNPTFDTVYRYASALGWHVKLTAELLANKPNIGDEQPSSSESWSTQNRSLGSFDPSGRRQ